MDIFRSGKHLDLCRGQVCHADIPGVCNGDSGTVVASHSPNLDYSAGARGMGQKVSDALTAPICSACHDTIDGRANHLSPVDRQFYWNRAFFKWINHLITASKLVM